MSARIDSEPNSEQLHDPQHWWEILRTQGEFWVDGPFLQSQVDSLANTVGAEVETTGFVIPDEKRDRFLQTDRRAAIDIHGTALHPKYSYTSYLPYLPEKQTFLSYENPVGKEKVGFSYKIVVGGMGNRGGGVNVYFNFRLPRQEARQLTDVLSNDPSIIERIFISRYASLHLDRYASTLLVVIGNVENLFPGERENPFTTEVEHSMEENASHKLLVIEDQRNFLHKNLTVYSVSIGTNEVATEEDRFHYLDLVEHELSSDEEDTQRFLNNGRQSSNKLERFSHKVQKILKMRE